MTWIEPQDLDTDNAAVAGAYIINDNSSNWDRSLNVDKLSAKILTNSSKLVMNEWYERFHVTVEKTDALGTKRLQFGSDGDRNAGASQKQWWQENAANQGFYFEDGKYYLLIDVVVTSRVTGTALRAEVPIELAFVDDASDLPAGAQFQGRLPNGLNTFEVVDLREIGKIGNQLVADDDPVSPGTGGDGDTAGDSGSASGDDGAGDHDGGDAGHTGGDSGSSGGDSGSAGGDSGSAGGDSGSAGGDSGSTGGGSGSNGGGSGSTGGGGGSNGGGSGSTGGGSGSNGGGSGSSGGGSGSNIVPGTPFVSIDEVMEFNRKSDGIRVVEHTDAMKVGSGTFSFSFNADIVSGKRGLISKDLDGRLRGDGSMSDAERRVSEDSHFSVFVKDGELFVAMHNDGSNLWARVGKIQTGRDYDVELDFGEDGVQVTLNGKVVLDRGFQMDFFENDDDILIGTTREIGEDAYRNNFDGEIWDVSFSSGESVESAESSSGVSLVGEVDATALDIDPLLLDGAFTVETWVRFDEDKRINNKDGLLAMGDKSDGADINFYNNKMRLYSHEPGKHIGDFVVAETAMKDGEWTHVALTRDDRGNLAIYINGELDAESTRRFTRDFEVDRLFGSVVGASRGQFEDFAVWSYEMSEAEVVAAMQDQTQSNSQGLLLNYDFDDAGTLAPGILSGVQADDPIPFELG